MVSASSIAYEFAKRLMYRLFHKQRAVSRRARGSICEPLENRMLLSAVTVTGVLDVVDGNTASIAQLIANPGSDSVISLREAINAANATPGVDVIDFDPLLSGLTLQLASDLTVTQTLIVNGLGEDQLTLSADGIQAFFNVDMTNDVDGIFALADMTLQGNVEYAIYANPGHIALDNVTLKGDANNVGDLTFFADKITIGDLTAVDTNVIIEASGDIQIASITNPGNDITIDGDTITITNFLSSSAIIESGDAGDITITANGSITISSLYAQGASGYSLGGDGGSISMESYNSNITISGDLFSTLGGISDVGVGGMGGILIISGPAIIANDLTIATNFSGSINLDTIGSDSSGVGLTLDTVGMSMFEFDNNNDFGSTGGGITLGDSTSGGITLGGSGSGTTIGQTITVGGTTTSPLNTSPLAHDFFANLIEDSTQLTFNFDAEDGEGDSLTYQILSQPDEGQVINHDDGTFTYIPGDWLQLLTGQDQEITFDYRVIDEHGLASDPATISLTIEGRDEILPSFNLAPVALPSMVWTDDQTAININVLGRNFDPDGDLLITAGVDAVSQLGVPLQVNSDGTIAYDPTGLFDDLTPGQSVRDYFRYDTADPYGQTDEALIFVNVKKIANTFTSLESLFPNDFQGPILTYSRIPVMADNQTINHSTLIAIATASLTPTQSIPVSRLGSLLTLNNDEPNALHLMLVVED